MKVLKTIGLFAVLAAALAASGARPAYSQQGFHTYYGGSRSMGFGNVRSWVTIDSGGTPIAVGVMFRRSALAGLPPVDTGYTLSLPSQSGSTGYTEVEVDWNPRGHIPTQIYGVPHFDFHFYLMGHAARQAMTATGEDLIRAEKVPQAQYVPKGYIAAPGGVMPQMGAHWVSLASPEFNGQPFTASFIYGFYNGSMAFIEPMMTRSFLLDGQSFSRYVALPQTYEKRGYYPTYYGMNYSAQNRTYTVFLGGLTERP